MDGTRHTVANAIDILTTQWLPPDGHSALAAADGRLLGAKLAEAIERLMPDRVVRYGSDCLGEDLDYAPLVVRYASATREEWQPERLRSAVDRLDAEAIVEFTFRGEPFRWRFLQDANRVSLDFLRLLASFVATHLTGQYVYIPTSGDDVLAVYLPMDIARQLELVVQQLRRE
jgi:hypothetical protein